MFSSISNLIPARDLRGAPGRGDWPSRSPVLARSAADSGPHNRGPPGPPPAGPDGPGEFFGSARIRTMDGLVDHRRADSPALEEQRAVIRAGPRLQVLILCARSCLMAPPTGSGLLYSRAESTTRTKHYLAAEGNQASPGGSELGQSRRPRPRARGRSGEGAERGPRRGRSRRGRPGRRGRRVPQRGAPRRRRPG